MEEGGLMKKRDFSQNCNKNDEDLTNPCLECSRFLFPIGCMIEEEACKRYKMNKEYNIYIL